jgi:hypothetical protein
MLPLRIAASGALMAKAAERSIARIAATAMRTVRNGSGLDLQNFMVHNEWLIGLG